MKQNKIIKRIVFAVGVVAVAVAGTALSLAVVGFALFYMALFSFILLVAIGIHLVRFLLWRHKEKKFLGDLRDPFS